VLALAACLYTIPWRRGGCKDAARSFSVLWRGRAWLSLLAAALSLSLLLRVSLLWGPNSLLFPASITSWTGAGWMCRWVLRCHCKHASPQALPAGPPPGYAPWHRHALPADFLVDPSCLLRSPRRIYLTVSLGVLQPLCAFTALLMLTAALRCDAVP
jgi:hypothetical protein